MKDLSNENIIHIKRNNIEYIQFKKLLDYKEIVHAFTLNKFGFDIGSNSTFIQNKDKFVENYKILAKDLNIDYNNIIRPYQTHTDCIKIVEKQVKEISIFPDELTNVDGLLTTKSNIVFSLTYADCTPLFLYDPIKKVIGNIHSGWRGTVQKIGQKAVKTMIEKYNSNPKDIICCIGPTIRKCHFEVDEDVMNLFHKQFYNISKVNNIIEKKPNNKYNIDTVLINKLMLKEIGLIDKNIIDSNICSCCNSDIIHSYRMNKEKAGRCTAIIGLRK